MKKLIPLLCIMILVACSTPQDPKDATKSNFKSALQQFASTKKAFLNVDVIFPCQIPISGSIYKENSDVLNEFVDLGFLESEDVDVEPEKKNIFDRGTDTKNQKVPGKKYTLTETGKKISRQGPMTLFSKGGTDFTYGEYTVVSVDNFTEPADTGGKKISTVDFSVSATNISEWAKNSQILRAKYKNIEKDLQTIEEPQKGKAILVLTNKGWVHETQI